MLIKMLINANVFNNGMFIYKFNISNEMKMKIFYSLNCLNQ